MTEPAGYVVGRGFAGYPRIVALAIVAAAYVVGLVAGVVVWAALPGHHPVTVALWADVAATVGVFAVSMVVANSSVYDPYWSVAPPVIAIAWVWYAETGVAVRQLLVVALILVWAVRLTGHWAGTWRGLGHEDWRYVDLRTDTAGRLPWWLVSFGGIQLLPTLVVFAGLLSVWPAVSGTGRIGVLDVLALVVTVAAIAVEAVADAQLKRFAADPGHRGQVADVGLWRWVRHPNYLGEITFWWGLWLFGLAANPGWWWSIAGPVAMVALFVFASVPMMDRRSLARRPAYADYMAAVPALLPRPWRLRRGAS